MSDQGYGTSPSNTGKERRSVLSANFPPLDPQKEDPTEEDKLWANSTKETLKNQRGAISTRDLVIIGGVSFSSAALGAGAVIAVDRVFADENEVSRDSVPGGTSFDDNRLVFNNPDSSPQSVAAAETTKVDPKEVFDNSKDEGVVSKENILYVPEEVFNNTPRVDKDGYPILDFPWDNKYPDIQMRYKKSLSHPPDWWKSGPPDPHIRNKLEGESRLPVGFGFPALWPDSRVFFSANPYNPEEIWVAAIKFKDSNGILWSVGVSIKDNQGGTLPIKPLINVVLGSPDNRNSKDWERGELVEGVQQKIFSTMQEGTLHIFIRGGKNGSFYGPEKEIIPGNFVFQTRTDPNGVTKLLVPEAR